MKIIEEYAKAGLPIDNSLIIDAHCHMGLWHNFHIPHNTAEHMIARMDRLGIDIACVAPHIGLASDYRLGNDMIIQTISKYPKKFFGYAVVNPHYEIDMQAELNRCFEVPGIIGIKLHPSSHGTVINDKRFNTAYKTADKRECPILIHVWGKADVAAIDELASQYKGAKFIMGHAGAEIGAMADAFNVINRNENVYADLALSTAYEGNVEWFISEVSSKKVLFGTDIPFFDPSPVLGRVAMARISEEEKRDILGLNMQRLTGLKSV